MGSAEGAAKSRARAIAKNPNFQKEIAAKGGKAVKKEDRAFSKDPELARRASLKRWRK